MIVIVTMAPVTTVTNIINLQIQWIIILSIVIQHYSWKSINRYQLYITALLYRPSRSYLLKHILPKDQPSQLRAQSFRDIRLGLRYLTLLDRYYITVSLIEIKTRNYQFSLQAMIYYVSHLLINRLPDSSPLIQELR